MPNQPTYISLFSGAGVGCYGFKRAGFRCIATNELIERRLAVQKSNHKCDYDSGYILGDVTTPEVKQLLFDEIDRWRATEQLTDVDVVIATPPCQGMSVANHKKSVQEIVRNSLIVQSIRLIAEIMPKVFVFENVPLFLSTRCTDTDDVERSIGEAIDRNLGGRYSIYARVLNFKDYGACSSRSRTLVVAVRHDLADYFSPLELFPDFKPEQMLRSCIGDIRPLTTLGEIDSEDIYHSFRPYPAQMRAWIELLAEGESAFDNTDTNRIPHQIIDGKMVVNQRKNGDKYRRQLWDKVGPCIHTRNDLLASQNTVHPADDRVFSIRELMLMMTVPSSFRWVETPLETLNQLKEAEKKAFLKKHEMNIRQSLGEAVPTEIFYSIATHIKEMLDKRYLKDSEVRAEIAKEQLSCVDQLVLYIRTNPLNLGFASLCRIAELANSKRNEQEAYFTNKTLITEMCRQLPEIGGDVVRILEPSVGAGSFIPFLIKLFADRRAVQLTVVDIDPDAILVLQALLQHLSIPDQLQIEFVCADFLSMVFADRYHLVIGNPPFSKSVRGSRLAAYRANSVNKLAANTSAFFLEKAAGLGDFVAMVMPKFLLNTPEFAATRQLLVAAHLDCILDFGELGFGTVLIETIAIYIHTVAKPSKTKVVSVTERLSRTVPQKYICDKKFPYWLIYRDESFDGVCCKMTFGVFDVFRDRQLTNAMMSHDPVGIRVIKARNISDDGSQIISLAGYDTYVQPEVAASLAVYRFLEDDSVYLTPNMTYKPRVIRKPRGVLVNGSAAILQLRAGQPPLTPAELQFFASPEYRSFYAIARNRQTRSLNVDANSVYFFGRLIEEEACNE